MGTDVPLVQQPLRLGLQQRLLPAYRAEFFDALAAESPGGLSVFAGQPMPGEAMGPQAVLHTAVHAAARNRYYFPGIFTLVQQEGGREWLESWRPGVVIVEANPRNLSNPGLIRQVRQRGGKVIGWGLGAPSQAGGLAGLHRAWWSRLLRQYDALITYSRQGGEQYARLGFDPRRVFLAPNAAVHRPAQPPPNRPEALVRPPAVLFVGRLQPRKRVDLLIRACASLPPALQPELRIVGDGPAAADLRRLAGAIYPRTAFLGDLRGADLDAQLAAADLFVLPGTGGLALQQAMASGLPVIAAEADGTQADLVRPENGWQLPGGSLPALAAALGEALQDVPRLRRMGAASYRIVTEEINLEAMVRGFLCAVAYVTRPPAAG